MFKNCVFLCVCFRVYDWSISTSETDSGQKTAPTGELQTPGMIEDLPPPDEKTGKPLVLGVCWGYLGRFLEDIWRYFWEGFGGIWEPWGAPNAHENLYISKEIQVLTPGSRVLGGFGELWGRFWEGF